MRQRGFSKNGPCHLSHGKAPPSCGRVTVCMYKASRHRGNRLILTLFPLYHYGHIRTPYSDAPPPLYFLLGGGERQYAHSFKCSVIITLCYDKWACDRALRFVFGVITKKAYMRIDYRCSLWQRGFSFCFGSRIISFWRLITEDVERIIRRPSLDLKNTTGTSQRQKQADAPLDPFRGAS